MWLLTCEGDTLDHKTLWLRPGSQHLFGRTTSKDRNVRYIDHKSVSRKHLLITVDPVQPGVSTHVHSRSIVTLTDASKSGTFVNGERLEKAKRVVNTANTKIQLGSSKVIFHIRWQAVVLSFSNLTKTQKARADPLHEYREPLERADIKLVNTYLSDATTHVVAGGRNNPSCLQALAQAKWIVQYAWLAAVMQAVKSENDQPSSLETDFDGLWPDEKQFIVPSGTEPVPQPDAMLRPDVRRSEVFKGLTFVFTNDSHFQTLMPVVAAGGGKAHMQEVVVRQTAARDFIDALRDYFNQTKIFKSSSEPDLRKVVVVRVNQLQADTGWWENFYKDVENLTHKKTIAQSAFLNAILTIDTAEMCESVDADVGIEVDMLSSSLPGPEQLPASTQQSPPRDTPQALPPADTQRSIVPSNTQGLGRTRRLATQSRFKGFDDFDPSQITHPTSPSPEPEAAMTNGHAESTRKRPLNADEHVPEASSAKKQRLERQTPERATSKPDAFSRKPKDRLPDVKARLLERKKKEEEEQELRKIDISKQMDGLTVEDMKKFVQHQEFEVTISETRLESQCNRQASTQWNPAWNGRRNFKGFKPQGAHRDEPRQQRVMVSLEAAPVKRATFLEDEYYLESQQHSRIGGVVTARDPNVRTQQSSNSTLLPATNASERSQLVATTQTEKRPFEGELGGREAKRPRRRVAMNLDEDDDDELQFRRKRL
ncbi:hypothetical protein AMS68_003403 [Peltaster fructicola]|uniref:FHA domain-containing protein n=1 Tax=Peltaster fructicola TaxID=286661 RepID=A0A6H0XT89_9PEZI|nr:hypothetical protein AMS68_003403 [Peltaster fructicola]